MKPPRLRVRRDKVTWNKALPALGPVVLAAYFCVYWAPLLPEWFYYNQFELFLGLWGLLTAAALIFLALGRRWGMLLPTAAVHLGCLAYPGLLRWERSYSRLTGKVLADTGKLNSNAYQSFGQPSWGLLLAGVGLVLAYLLCCAVRLEAVPRVSKDGPEPRSTQ